MHNAYRRIGAHGAMIALLLPALLIAGCATTKSEEPMADAPKDVAHQQNTLTDTPLIPRSVLFGNPDRAAVRISPDGAHLSWLAPLDGVLNVWVAPRDDLSQARAVTHDDKRGIRIYFWAYTSSHIVYMQDFDGDENWHVYAVDLASGEQRDLTPIDGVNAQIEAVSHRAPERLLVGLNDRNPQLHDVWDINLLTGERTLVEQNPGFAGFLIDDDLRVRLAQRMTPDGGAEILLRESDGRWGPLIQIGMEDALMTGPRGFDRTGDVVYFSDSRDRNTAALYAYELAAGERTLIAENPLCDVADLMLHPTENTVQAVSFEYDRTLWQFMDPAVEEDFNTLADICPGEILIVGRTLDDAVWVVAFTVDDGPVRYYVYDRASKSAEFLFTNRGDLEGLPLVPMHSRTMQTRDGLTLVNYLSLPPGSDPDGDGVPDKPLPMVLNVHGGPWARVSWGYDPTHQWFANRGYAVLDVNFRGSTGFGKEFLNAAIKEWGGKMHDDLIDAVDWAVRQGIADPDKVAIYGGSYGGYAVLVGLTFTPDVFACGIDIVGPSNLITLLESIPPYWAPVLDMFKTRVGDHTTEEGRAFLTERSPLTYVDRIQRPLLIGQGANDPRVKQTEADQIVAAMEEKSIPVTYVLFPDEGHGFARPENNLAFSAVAEAFLAPVLGGRFQPVGDDFRDASIQIVTGAEHVPGLPDAPN